MLNNLGDVIRAAYDSGNPEAASYALRGAAAMGKDVTELVEKNIQRAKVDPAFARLWARRMGVEVSAHLP